MLQCLDVGQGKYTIRKCEAQDYENGTKLAFHCLKGSRLNGELQYQCFDGKWDNKIESTCQSRFHRINVDG